MSKYGKFKLNKGRHTYTSSAKYSNTILQLKITSREVIVMNTDMREITRHHRLYGDTQQESMNWVPYLEYIARRPRSLHNSGIYEMMPEGMQVYLDQCENQDRGKILKVLSALTDNTGFDSAVATVNQAIQHQAVDPDSLQSIYRRMYSDVPELPPLNYEHDLLENKVIPINTDLQDLDRVLRGGVVNA